MDKPNRHSRNVSWSVALAFTACLLLYAVPAYSQTSMSGWKELGESIFAELDEAKKVYESGDTESAKRILSDAYFEKFEAVGMEMVVRKYFSAAKAYEMERAFAKVRKAMIAADNEKLQSALSELKNSLELAAARLDEKNIPLEGAGYVLSPSASLAAAPPIADTPVEPGLETFSPGNVAEEIEDKLEEALALYMAGDSRRAETVVSDAYFDLFEGKGFEVKVSARSGGVKVELESMFANILGLIEKGAGTKDVESHIVLLSARLKEVAGELNMSTGIFTFFINSLFIILREGFEAILILSALVAYLNKTDNRDKVKFIGYGALGAILLSILTAILFLKIYTDSGASREILEGVAMLFAAFVLFYVSYWLTSKAEAAKWMEYIQSQVQKSIGTGNIFMLALVSFTVVYREGAETILFYAALLSSAGEGGFFAVTGGFVTGSILLLLMYYGFRYGTARIPIRPFFTVTSAILYFMAFVFAGQGVVELQIGGLIRATPVDWAPRIGFLGITPTVESLTLQGLLLSAAFIALSYLFILQPFRERGRVLRDVSHTLGDIQKLHDGVEHIRTHTAEARSLTSTTGVKEISDISEHLGEIDEYSHELMGHLKNLEKDLSAVLGNINNKEKRKS